MSTVMEAQPSITAATLRIDQSVRRRIADCSYRFVFNKVSWHYEARSLTFSGCVPSFYLKQVLQEMMRGIEQVDHIQNRVEVVNSTGLSSEGTKSRNEEP